MPPPQIAKATPGFIGQAERLPRWVDFVVLADNNPAPYVVPLAAQFLKIRPLKADGSAQAVFCNANATASIPNLSTNTGAGSFPVVEPLTVLVDGGETLSFIRTGAATVFVSLSVYSA